MRKILKQKNNTFYHDEMGLEFSEKLDYSPSYNIAPSQNALVTTADNPRMAELMHFGLVPFQDKKMGYSMINARQETVLEKASFKPLFNQGKRCLVYADSFYEWKKEGKDKQPFRIKLIDREVCAGLWSIFKDADNSDYYSFSIITTTPNKLTKEVHDRMPVILTEEEENIWLDTDQKPDDFPLSFFVIIGIVNAFHKHLSVINFNS